MNRLHCHTFLILALCFDVVVLIPSLSIASPTRGDSTTTHLAGGVPDTIPLLVLRVPQHDYVLGEPIKFEAELHNPTNRTFAIFAIQELSENMDCTFFEVTYPDGHVEHRRFRSYLETSFMHPRYPGEPLAPGASVYFTLYPNLSHELEKGRDSHRLRRGRTFDSAGEYRVRLCYYVSDYFTELWKPETGELYSNPVTLTFHDPDALAAEIINVLWADGGMELSREDRISVDFDANALEAVIAKFPEHPLTKYARYCLGKACITSLGPAYDPRRGIAVFEELIHNYPEFRHRETRTFLAFAYFEAGRPEDALRVLEELEHECPYVKDHLDFVTMKLIVRSAPDSEIIGRTLWQWREARIEGLRAEAERILQGD